MNDAVALLIDINPEPGTRHKCNRDINLENHKYKLLFVPFMKTPLNVLKTASERDMTVTCGWISTQVSWEEGLPYHFHHVDKTVALIESMPQIQHGDHFRHCTSQPWKIRAIRLCHAKTNK